jgi:flagellar biosynthetic protein FliP
MIALGAPGAIDLNQALPAAQHLLGPAGSAQALRLIVLLTVLSLLPTILLTLTCFTRIVVVLSFLRHGLGAQGVPPNQVTVGLALFLTFFLMAPTAETIYRDAARPYLENRLTEAQAIEAASPPLRRFMLPQTREGDLLLFHRLAGLSVPAQPEQVSLRALVPAFVISELRTACEMGFLVLVPFLLIDLLVASLLTAMGMVMVPPGPVALPLKLLLFILVDGWSLLVTSLARSFS